MSCRFLEDGVCSRDGIKCFDANNTKNCEHSEPDWDETDENDLMLHLDIEEGRVKLKKGGQYAKK